MLQKHDVKAEQDPRTKSRNISLIILKPKFAYKEQAHTCQYHDDRDEVSPMKLLADHERSEYQYVNRSCVLKEDRVSGGGFFRRPNEQEQQKAIDQCCDDAETVYFQAVLSRDDQDRDGRKQRTEERYLICIKRCQLDEKTAGAP